MKREDGCTRDWALPSGSASPPLPAPHKYSVLSGASRPSPGPVVSGIPKPEVTWFLDGAPLRRREGTIEVYEAGGAHYLCLLRARARDNGNYSCTATNVRGRVSCGWTLLVKSEYIPPGHPGFPEGGPLWGASYSAQASPPAAPCPGCTTRQKHRPHPPAKARVTAPGE